jgi:hypothetical protein
LVDSAVLFLVIAFIGLLLGISIWALVITALLIGLPLAPWTRRAEEQALARRQTPDT